MNGRSFQTLSTDQECHGDSHVVADSASELLRDDAKSAALTWDVACALRDGASMRDQRYQHASRFFV